MEKAVIFDLDGTLINSAPDIMYNLNKMLAHFGYKEIDYSEFTKIIGHGAKNLVKDAVKVDVDGEKLQEYLDYYNQRYTSNPCEKTVVYEGVYEVLISLKQKGYKLAICTNKPQTTTDEIVKKLFKNFTFDCIYGHADGRALKPDKNSIFPILNKLKVLPKNTYIVGDMATDFLSAQNVGSKPICALWGYGNEEQLKNLGAKEFALIPKDLLLLIK